jgi:hypothetical protein
VNSSDKQYLESVVRSGKMSYTLRLSIDMAVGATLAVLIVTETFGQHNQIACLIVVVYAQLSAISMGNSFQTEANSDKLDIVKGGDCDASRELWGKIYITQREMRINFLLIYCCLNLALIIVSLWKLFSAL